MFAIGFASVARGQTSAPAGPQPGGLQRGTSTTFPKRLEIMGRDSFSRRSPPLPAETALANLIRYDAIWAGQLIANNNSAAWTQLRERHPDILALYYMSSDTTRKLDAGFFDYGYIEREHPEWFLKRDGKTSALELKREPDRRIRWVTDPEAGANYDRFYLDVTNPAFQDWAVQQVLERVSGACDRVRPSYNGLAFDNVHIGSRRMKSITRRHSAWQFAGRLDSWNRGYFAYLGKVRRALNERGLKLAVNHTLNYGSTQDASCWDELLQCADIIMTEQSLRYGSSPYYSGRQWDLSMERHERILAKGLVDWWVCYPETHEGFLYEYCSWLLVRKPGQSLFFATRGNRSWSNPETPWYAEYELPIGEPLGPRVEHDGLWWRAYQQGLVAVNPSIRTIHVSLANGPQWIDAATAESADTLALKPASACILIPAALRRHVAKERARQTPREE